MIARNSNFNDLEALYIMLLWRMKTAFTALVFPWPGPLIMDVSSYRLHKTHEACLSWNVYLTSFTRYLIAIDFLLPCAHWNGNFILAEMIYLTSLLPMKCWHWDFLFITLIFGWDWEYVFVPGYYVVCYVTKELCLGLKHVCNIWNNDCWFN